MSAHTLSFGIMQILVIIHCNLKQSYADGIARMLAVKCEFKSFSFGPE